MAIRSLRGRWRVLAGLASGGVAALGLGVALLRADAPPDDHAAVAWQALRAGYDEAIPDDTALRDGLARAVDLRRRAHFDRVLDAREPGELSEPATRTESG